MKSMSLNGTDAVAVATIVGAAALTFIGANALFGSQDRQAETCSFDASHVSVTRDGHRIEIQSGPLAEALILRGELSSNHDRHKRRKRHRHRHPRRHADRQIEANVERCVEAKIESQLEQVEAMMEAQMRHEDMRAVEARVQAELSRVGADMERLRFRVRTQKAN